MNRKLLALLFLLVAAAACLILVFAGNFYRSTSFYLLGEGEGTLTPSELFFFPDSGTGQGYYVAASGNWTACDRLLWEAQPEGESREVSYYRYGNKIFTAEENAVNFYGGNTLDRFLVVEGEKKYLTEISLGSTRPLFEGSTLCDPYGAGVDAISSDGGYAAGIRGEVLTVLALETSNFSPTEKKEIRLSERGLSKAQVLRFINERHLWLSCEKEGKARGYLCDASTGELIELPLLPEGYETERLSRVWHQGGLRENEETKAWEIPFFHAVTGREILLSLSREEFSSVELLALSPNGEYAAVKCEREGQEVYGSYRFADGSLTLFEGRPLRVDFASEQVMVLQTDAGYRAVRIVH